MIDADELYKRLETHLKLMETVMELPLARISWHDEYHDKYRAKDAPKARVIKLFMLGVFHYEVVISSNQTYATISDDTRAFMAHSTDEAEEILLKTMSEKVETHQEYLNKLNDAFNTLVNNLT